MTVWKVKFEGFAPTLLVGAKDEAEARATCIQLTSRPVVSCAPLKLLGFVNTGAAPPRVLEEDDFPTERKLPHYHNSMGESDEDETPTAPQDGPEDFGGSDEGSHYMSTRVRGSGRNFPGD